MNRRRALTTLGASLASLTCLPAASVAEGNGDNRGAQPIGGELPNENVPQAYLDALPPSFGTTDTTRDVGTFLTLSGGWAGVTDRTEEMLDSTRQTFTYGDQTFVLDSADKWERQEDGSFVFTHTDTPYPKGATVDVSWDVVVTDSFYDPTRDKRYEEGDRYVESVFPTSRTYEIVGKKGE